jgi:hypothetical protein
MKKAGTIPLHTGQKGAGRGHVRGGRIPRPGKKVSDNFFQQFGAHLLLTVVQEYLDHPEFISFNTLSIEYVQDVGVELASADFFKSGITDWRRVVIYPGQKFLTGFRRWHNPDVLRLGTSGNYQT